MRKEHLVTYNQALKLRELGFHDPVSHYGFKAYSDSKKTFVCEGILSDWNKDTKTFVSIPTVYEASDWLWRKYKIEISHGSTKGMLTNKWFYGANLWYYENRWQEMSAYKTSLSLYSVYRMQISQAIKWILSHKSKGKSKKINLSKVKK